MRCRVQTATCLGVALALVPAAAVPAFAAPRPPAATRPSAVDRLADALADLREDALRLDQRAAEAPAPQLGLVTAEERAAAADFAAAWAAFEALLDERPRLVDRATASDLVEELEVAWSALRDVAAARRDKDRGRLRDAAQSLRWAATIALEILGRTDSGAIT